MLLPPSVKENSELHVAIATLVRAYVELPVQSAEAYRVPVAVASVLQAARTDTLTPVAESVYFVHELLLKLLRVTTEARIGGQSEGSTRSN